jgi:signal transduction histidine kinase
MEYELKIHDLVPLVQSAIAELEVQANEKQIQIQVSVPDSPLMMECDGDRIIQVFLNVIGNAVKFSQKNSDVQISIQRLPQVPERIPQRRLCLVQGVGLGLSICRTIMEAHRGAIWVENNLGGGCKFKVLLGSN